MSAADQTVKTEEPTPAGQPEAPPVAVSWRRRWVNYLVFIPLVALATGFFGTISLVCGIWDTSRPAATCDRQRVGAGAAAHRDVAGDAGACGAAAVGGAAVYASNHLSYYDTPVVFAKLPFQFRILAKAPLWKIPFIGWYLERSGQVPIDQSSARAGMVSLARGARTLEAGMPMVIFPEGGRAFNGELQPMLAGAAWMAIKAQVPLVPMTLVGTYELLPIHVYALKPRPVKLIVGEPISTVGMTTKDAEALTERLRAVIHATYIAEHG